MKYLYILAITLIFSSQLSAQNKCGDADSYLNYAYSNVKDAYESNNIDHLKYYSEKSLKSFEKAKVALKNCNCTTAFDLAFDSIELLEKVENAETFEDGRFFVKRAKENAQECIVELDKFNSASNNNNQELSSIEDQQESLEAQQKALQQKALELQQKIEAQNLKALQLKKEKLINNFKTTIAVNIKSYNDLLNMYDYNGSQISFDDSNNDLENQSLEAIKTYYLKSIKDLNSQYLNALNTCKI